MSRIFITGSSDGLGQMAAKLLIDQGHQVVLHARNAERAKHATGKLPKAENILIADLSDMDETKSLAAQVNALGAFDAVIHNAGVYQVPAKVIVAVNTLAPYILTCLINAPKRLVYLSSDMQAYGKPNLENLAKGGNNISYSDSKLQVLMLSLVVARKWRDVYSNAVDPGWVPTKMGGPGAPDDLAKGCQTQAWLAVSDDANAKESGRYFYHQKESSYNKEADDVAMQEKFLSVCEEITRVALPPPVTVTGR
ncbi:SDR family NAD(P)-dependent oxidoreductase [Flavihumibacter solisilvae]|uniref:Daunorubicin C-13 ketoreductase n=1 Tax=Flavihumibacter solisilvae TaxID=1349421 RepID=A0A0C1IME0_9BACT|nr:SDR family NAD(P)-dependent oxidoreductase [Flavihumibacter solisilvae]KIC95420.1 hypothetical protein OI18_05875 [Flavihumibacter solisilvae]